jgi:hypothetical protein
MNKVQKSIVLVFTIAIASIFLFTIGNHAFAIEYEKCGITVQYPDGWTVQESNFVSKENNYRTLVDFYPEADMIGSVSINIDNSRLAKKSMGEISDFLRDYATSWPDSTVIESKITEINGFPTHKIAYTGGLWGGGSLSYLIIAYDRGYELTFEAFDKQEYDKYSSSIDEMVESIKISEPTFEGINC